MSELDAVAKILQELGVSGLFAPLLATVIIFYLFKKYVFAGASEFLTKLTGEYLKSLNERIALETKIDFRLEALTNSLDKFVAQLVDWERRNSERIVTLKTELGERITNIEVVLSDRVFEELKELKSHFEEHTETMEDSFAKGHDCKKKISELDTQEFRTIRDNVKKML